MSSRPPFVPSRRELLGLAWPIVVSRSTQVVVGFADAIMVAGLGEAALAATTTGALDSFVVLVFPMGVSAIIASFASQLFGAGDFAGARRYGFYGLVLAAVMQLVGVGAALAAPAVLAHTEFAPDVQALMSDYLRVRLAAMGPAVGIEALSNYYAGVGNTRLPMLASLLAMILNVAGNWLLIGGNLGAPALGVTGAAVASVVASAAGFALLAASFWRGIGTPGGRARSRLRAMELWRMLRFGLPAGLNWTFEFGAYLFFVNVVMAGLGTAAVASLNAVMQLNSVSFMPAFGLASAGAVFVGQAIGGRAPEAAPRIVRATLVLTASWQGLAGLAYLLAPRLLLTPFAETGSAAFMDLSVSLLMLSAAWQLFDAMGMTYGEALRAAGDTAFAMWSRVLVAWLIFVPGTLVSARVLDAGPLGASAWLVAYLVALALVLAWRFRRGRWREIELTRGEGAALPTEVVS